MLRQRYCEYDNLYKHIHIYIITKQYYLSFSVSILFLELSSWISVLFLNRLFVGSISDFYVDLCLQARNSS